MTCLWLPTRVPPVKSRQILGLLPIPVVVAVVEIGVGRTETRRGQQTGSELLRGRSGHAPKPKLGHHIGPDDGSHTVGAIGAVLALPALRVMARVLEVLGVQTGLRGDPRLCGHAPALRTGF